jgi:hypothetical protein
MARDSYRAVRARSRVPSIARPNIGCHASPSGRLPSMETHQPRNAAASRKTKGRQEDAAHRLDVMTYRDQTNAKHPLPIGADKRPNSPDAQPASGVATTAGRTGEGSRSRSDRREGRRAQAVGLEPNGVGDARIPAVPLIGTPREAPFLTQREAAVLLRVSVSYLRWSDCPKVLLPGRGDRRIVRYSREDVVEWANHWRAT